MRKEQRSRYESCLKTVMSYRASETGRAWENLLEAVIEQRKEDLVFAKADRMIETQGAIKELKRLLEAARNEGE